MKYFHVVIPSNTDHPNGKQTLEAYIAAESKAEAKVKAAEYLYEQDGKFAIYYKAPRFEEITEELYISKTEKQLDHVDEFAIKQYCALLSLFSEQDSYDEDEVRDAQAMISNPEGEEPEDVARYDALLQKVTAHRETMAKDAPLADIKSAVLYLYRGEEVGSEVVHKSDDIPIIINTNPELPPEAVDKPEENALEPTETVEAVDVDESVNYSPACDNRSSESDETKARDWPDLELDIARALWEGELHWEFIPYEVEQWAQKIVKRRDVEMIRWLLALRKVPDILSRSREFVFKVIRTPHDQDIYLTPEAIYAYVARFVEPETTVASETADVPAIAEPETVDAEATESEIHYSPEENMPAFLRDLKPVNGAVEDGRLFATVDALNARLTDIPAGCSLVLWGLDNGLYHAADGYSSTQLRLLQSGGAASLDWYRDAPCLDEASPCLTLGSALHTALLEPERFAADYLCTPSVNLRTNEGKAQKAEFLQQCREENKTALPEADYRRVCMMRDSARANPTVRALLQRGIAELSVYHRTAHGMLLKVRPDWLGEMSGAAFLLDLKSTGEVNDFGASVEKFGYHIQAAYYRTVVEKVFGREMDFVFCVVGKNLECGRYPVRLGMLDEEDEREGQYCVGELVTTLEVALREGIALDWGTFTRPWWARQADRKRRAEGVAA
ncbi:PD-(D/E)XK nuclease-like domain-containing protein [Sodalis sp. (in: enterobacteria)]|uniref:PD-(D/E)XK nuclease-like domain-containing protein n=1 Tax=Sodalis sp. (in: enterobacteria) TaxID=1898979 RepID=UPI003F347FE2